MATHAVKTRFNKNYFEHKAWSSHELICGIDEVGRGCLAGPLVVACVILHPNKISRHLRDSKIMTPEDRQKAAQWIIKNSWYALGIAHHRTIDTHNIYQTTLKTMKRAFLQLMSHVTQKPTTVVVDAMPLNLANTPFENIDVNYFPFGERKSSSIAAASIIAKVSRDYLMAEHFAKVMPGYEFESHKGYATPAHKQAIKTHGHSIFHRMSYLSQVYGPAYASNGQHTIEEYLNSQSRIDEFDHETVYQEEIRKHKEIS
jgi:ribonuclease HII